MAVRLRRGGTTAGLIQLVIKKNGTQIYIQNFYGSQQQVSLSVLLALNSGDYIDLYAYQNSGGALAASSSAPITPSFSMAKVG